MLKNVNKLLSLLHYSFIVFVLRSFLKLNTRAFIKYFYPSKALVPMESWLWGLSAGTVINKRNKGTGQ